MSQTEQETSPLLLAWPHWEKHSGNPTVSVPPSLSPRFGCNGGDDRARAARCAQDLVWVLLLTGAVLQGKSLWMLKVDFWWFWFVFFFLLQASGSLARGLVQRCRAVGR